MLQGLLNIFKVPDLRRKLLVTFAILVIYRLAAHVPLPNINREVLQTIAQESRLLNLLDMFSGGAMTNFSVMMLGVGPYITANIIFQLLIPIIPALEELQKSGEAGRNKIYLYNHIRNQFIEYSQAIVEPKLRELGAGDISRDELENAFKAARQAFTSSRKINVWSDTKGGAQRVKDEDDDELDIDMSDDNYSDEFIDDD